MVKTMILILIAAVRASVSDHIDDQALLTFAKFHVQNDVDHEMQFKDEFEFAIQAMENWETEDMGNTCKKFCSDHQIFDKACIAACMESENVKFAIQAKELDRFVELPNWEPEDVGNKNRCTTKCVRIIRRGPKSQWKDPVCVGEQTYDNACIAECMLGKHPTHFQPVYDGNCTWYRNDCMAKRAGIEANRADVKYYRCAPGKCWCLRSGRGGVCSMGDDTRNYSPWYNGKCQMISNNCLAKRGLKIDRTFKRCKPGKCKCPTPV